MSTDICVPQNGRCPHRPELKCSMPPDLRPFCTENEARRKTVKIRMQISMKTPGVSTQKPDFERPVAGDCFACYPQPGKNCSKCSKMADCQVQTYVSGLRNLAIAAEVRAVQARLF